MRALEVFLWWLWKGLLSLMIVILVGIMVTDVTDPVGRGLLSFFALCLVLVAICTRLDA